MSGGARSVAIPGMTKEKMQEQALPLSAAYVIWHRRFDCRIPQMYLHNLEAESIIGAPTSGDPQLDRQMARQRIGQRSHIPRPLAVGLRTDVGQLVALAQ